MKIKLLVSRAGMLGSQSAGDIIDTDEAEAKRMIEACQAEPFAVSKKESATVKKNLSKAAK